jgi:hypothetical protein
MSNSTTESADRDQVPGEVLRRLADEAEIRAVLTAYARGADRCDIELLRSVYHPDAYDNHGFFAGGVEEFLDWFHARHQTIIHSVHFLGSISIEFVTDSVALAETYVRSSQRSLRPGLDEGFVEDHQALARFIDRFERRDGVWRIAHRLVIFETSELRVVPADNGFPSAVTVALHSTDDASYAFRREHRVTS